MKNVVRFVTVTHQRQSAFAVVLIGTLLWVDRCTAADLRPNIVIIMVDDMGFSDLGCYGSEIETPHLDALAAAGLRFSQFYNTGRCCPTRAALLTGQYPHQVGIGHMTGDLGYTSYRGYLNDRCVTIAEALREAGYFTAISGKWHVGSRLPHWPRRRGFDRFYGIPQGGGHHYRTLPGRQVVLDDSPVGPSADWYSTTAFTDYAVKFLEQGRQEEKPVFLYLAYTAPHWPLQAPEETIGTFLGRYADGWQSRREARFRRQLKLGLFPPNTILAPLDPQTPDWTAISRQHAELDRRMAIHAAMVHLIDQGVGKLVAKLTELKQLNNTLILFLSDNGASAEGGPTGFVRADRGNPSAQTGTPDSYVSFGVAGANLCDTPFRKYKIFVHEGGIASPLIAHWPNSLSTSLQGKWSHEVSHVIDLMPTCLDVADVQYPTQFRSRNVQPAAGMSLVAALRGESLPERDLFFEHQGNAAVRHHDWKLVRMRGRPWELYEMVTDRTELTDRANEQPQRVSELASRWESWAKRVGVQPWPIRHRSNDN